MTDYEALAALAKAATPGPWRADDEHDLIPGATPAWCVSRTEHDEAIDYAAKIMSRMVEAEAAVARVRALCDEVDASRVFVSFDFHGNPFPSLVSVDAIRRALDGAES